MALKAPDIIKEYQSARRAAPYPFNGSEFDKLMIGIANGVVQWGIGNQSNLGLTGSASGLAGNGTITQGILTIPNNSLSVIGDFKAAGLEGPLGTSLAIVTALAISQAFSKTARYLMATVPGCAIGADISKVSASKASTLVQILYQTIGASNGTGPALPLMTKALGNGIANLLAQGSGQGPVTGAPTVPPAPGSAMTSSQVI